MDAKSAYDLVAASYAEIIPDTRYESALDLEMVELFAELVGEGRILDAGCGTGRMTAHLLARHPSLSLVGSDLSPEMLRQARLAVPDVEFVEGDLAALPFDDASFDGILVWYSTIHTPDEGLPTVFAELRRVVRDGGAVLLGFQAGSGERLIEQAYGHDGLDLVAYLREVDAVAGGLADAGFVVHTKLERGPRGEFEKRPQGFVLAVA
ncbi:class I SAM-dependent methyltransferase [Microbacterium sp. ASV49]|uniref:Class I SAM-dependent methyltransferase n=1 Tax=Microbacterium candidum TaxID=3041922 RepID=A0ABT7MTX3_9MICO|nr:class I SAM-dependent methyltransferase [Microbacterium sp. ASV49]MDL9977897.1 class I SAM-dependent methyltransferase [Microbacterium sp. ASV49]